MEQRDEEEYQIVHSVYPDDHRPYLVDCRSCQEQLLPFSFSIQITPCHLFINLSTLAILRPLATLLPYWLYIATGLPAPTLAILPPPHDSTNHDAVCLRTLSKGPHLSLTPSERRSENRRHKAQKVKPTKQPDRSICARQASSNKCSTAKQAPPYLSILSELALQALLNR